MDRRAARPRRQEWRGWRGLGERRPAPVLYHHHWHDEG